MVSLLIYIYFQVLYIQNTTSFSQSPFYSLVLKLFCNKNLIICHLKIEILISIDKINSVCFEFFHFPFINVTNFFCNISCVKFWKVFIFMNVRIFTTFYNLWSQHCIFEQIYIFNCRVHTHPCTHICTYDCFISDVISIISEGKYIFQLTCSCSTIVSLHIGNLET